MKTRPRVLAAALDTDQGGLGKSHQDGMLVPARCRRETFNEANNLLK
jgi:hypothetical protein